MLDILTVIIGSIYPLPQAIKAIKQGNSDGISKGFLFLWFLDKLITLIYVYTLLSVPLMLKYSIGLLCVLVVIYFKIWGKNE